MSATDPGVGRNHFGGSFLDSTLAYFVFNSTSPYVNLLILTFVPTISLYFMNMHSISLFVFALFSIAIFDERILFINQQMQFLVPSSANSFFNILFGNITPLLLIIFAVLKNYVNLASMYLTGYFFSSLMLTLGSVFLIAGCKHDVLRFHAKGIHFQVLFLVVGMAALVYPTIQSISDEISSTAAISTWSIIQAVFLLFLYVCYLTFKTITHSNIFGSDAIASSDTCDTYDTSDIKDVRILFSPIEDNAIPLLNKDTNHSNPNPIPNSSSTMVNLGSQKMEIMGVIVYVILSITALCISCAAAIASIENTSNLTSIPTSFLVIVLLPLTTCLVTVFAWTGAAYSQPVVMTSRSIQHALHSAITVLFFLYPVLSLTTGNTSSDALAWRLSDLTALEITGVSVTVLATAVVLPAGHGNWMTGVSFLCVYMALVTIFFAHAAVEL